MLSDAEYERSCQLAKKHGYREEKAKNDVTAYRGSYFIKNKKKWIHHIGYLMKQMKSLGYEIESDLDLEKYGYNVNDYYDLNSTEMQDYDAQLKYWEMEDELRRQDRIGEICRNEHIDTDEEDNIYEAVEQRGYDRFTLCKNPRDKDWEEDEIIDFLQDNYRDTKNYELYEDEIEVVNTDTEQINAWINPKEKQRLILMKLERRKKILFPKKRKTDF